MAAYVPSYLRGLILHDFRCGNARIDDTETTATQAGPVPDQPEPTTKGFLDLEALGAYIDEDEIDTYVIGASKEGRPTGGDPGGRSYWRKDGDASTKNRGWLDYNKITGFEIVQQETSSPGFNSGQSVTLPNGKMVHVYESAQASPQNEVRCAILGQDGTWTTEIEIADLATGQETDDRYYSTPCIARLPDNAESAGRLICLYWLKSGTSLEGAFSYSDDDGATWTEGGDELDGLTRTTGATDEQNHARMIYHRGYLTVIHWALIGGATQTLRHYVSTDLAASWSLVETVSPYYGGDLVTDDAGNVILAYVDAGDVCIARKESAFATFAASGTWGTAIYSGSSADASIGGFTAVKDAQGDVWTYWKDGGALEGVRFDPNTFSRVSDKWTISTGVLITFPGLFSSDANDGHFYHFGGGLWQDRIVLVGQSTQDAASTKDSLFGVYLGGYTSLDWQRRAFGYDAGANLIGQATLAIELPGNLGVLTGVGAGGETFTAGGVTLADTQHYLRTGSQSSTALSVCRVSEVLFGGGTYRTIMQNRWAHPTNGEYIVRLEVTTGFAKLVDSMAGAIGTLKAIPTGEPLDFILIVTEGRAYAAWKRPLENVWTEIGKGASVDTGGAGPTSACRFGIVTGGGGGDALEYQMWLNACDTLDEPTAWPMVGGTNPKSLQGTPFSDRPMWLDNGVRLQARGSAVYRGDSWTLAPRYQYGLQNLDPTIQSSPTIAWRSEDDAAAAIIAWDFGKGYAGTQGTRLMNKAMGVYLANVNFREWYLEASINGAAWTTIITADSSTQFDGGGTPNYDPDPGGTIAPDAATDPGGQYIEMDELVGGYAVLEDTSAATVVAKILENSEGAWRNPSASKGVDLLVADSVDLSTLSAPSRIRIIHPNMVGIAHNVTTNYQYWRLRIPAQDTNEGYFRCGQVILGGLAVFGKQYSWGRRIHLDTNVELFQDRRGGRSMEQRGPNRRAIEFSWTDPYITRDLYSGANPDPEYIRPYAGAGIPGIAVRGDASLLEGILSRQAGGTLPVTYLPEIPMATGAVVEDFTLTSRSSYLTGNIVGAGTTRIVPLGNELEGEVQTVEQVRIEELV